MKKIGYFSELTEGEKGSLMDFIGEEVEFKACKFGDPLDVDRWFLTVSEYGQLMDWYDNCLGTLEDDKIYFRPTKSITLLYTCHNVAYDPEKGADLWKLYKKLEEEN